MSSAPTGGGVDPWTVADPAGHRQYLAQILDALRHDYHLHSAEAEYAFGQYLGRLTGWLTPDHAAFQAHSRWTSTIVPSTTRSLHDEPRDQPEQAAQPRATDQQPDRDHPPGIDTQFAAVVAAISRIQTQARHDRFTAEHRQLVRQLREVLDAFPLYDTVTPADPAPDHPRPVDLEPALQPDTVRARVGNGDEVAIDAAFAGTTVTVVRTPGPFGPSRYTFNADAHNGRGKADCRDPVTIGLIATGTRAPDPARETEYLCLGLQVRTHLMGLVDALADSRAGWHAEQARRLNVARGPDAAANDTRRHRSPASPRPER